MCGVVFVCVRVVRCVCVGCCYFVLVEIMWVLVRLCACVL